jgi:hypothetical protein
MATSELVEAAGRGDVHAVGRLVARGCGAGEEELWYALIEACRIDHAEAKARGYAARTRQSCGLRWWRHVGKAMLRSWECCWMQAPNLRVSTATG